MNNDQYNKVTMKSGTIKWRERAVQKMLDDGLAHIARGREEKARDILKRFPSARLANAFANGNAYQRCDLCSILVDLTSDQHIPILIGVLASDESPCVRHEAAFALGQTRTPEALAALTEAVLTDPSVLVRHEAALALALFDPTDVEETLRKLLADHSVDVRESAEVALLEVARKKNSQN